MVRNVQVLGQSAAEPADVDIVICWTDSGRGNDGTGMALRLAADHLIRRGVPLILASGAPIPLRHWPAMASARGSARRWVPAGPGELAVGARHILRLRQPDEGKPLRPGSRGTGQSAAVKYDYISRAGKYEAACQDEVVHLESGCMPSFASSDARLYRAAARLPRAEQRPPFSIADGGAAQLARLCGSAGSAAELRGVRDGGRVAVHVGGARRRVEEGGGGGQPAPAPGVLVRRDDQGGENVTTQSLQSLPAVDRRLKRRPARWRTSGGRGPQSSVGFRRWGVMSRAV